MRFIFTCSLLLVGATSAFASPRIHRGPTSPHSARTHAAASVRSSHTVAHAQGISPERATEIQTALIKAGYLTGTPKGEWDSETQAAMEKMQADNGWQTKLVPDSRAIIKLGLGPGSKPESLGGAAPATPEMQAEAPLAVPVSQ
jgi:hypothetical protein